jgi:hypothetical protein
MKTGGAHKNEPAPFHYFSTIHFTCFRGTISGNNNVSALLLSHVRVGNATSVVSLTDLQK